MPTFKSFNQNSNNEPHQEVVFEKTGPNFLTKVFGTLFISLLATAIISGGLSAIFASLITGMSEQELFNFANILNIATSISALGLIIMSFAVPIVFAKGKHKVLPSFVLYVLFMGVLLSSLVLVIPWNVLFEAVGVSCLVFGILTIVGMSSKGRIPGLSTLIFGLLIGIFFLSLIDIILMLTGSNENILVEWVIECLFLAFIMFVTIMDIRRINTISSMGMENSDNVVIYSAFIIYTDFIGIFIRIVSFLIRSNRK